MNDRVYYIMEIKELFNLSLRYKNSKIENISKINW